MAGGVSLSELWSDAENEGNDNLARIVTGDNGLGDNVIKYHYIRIIRFKIIA